MQEKDMQIQMPGMLFLIPVAQLHLAQLVSPTQPLPSGQGSRKLKCKLKPHENGRNWAGEDHGLQEKKNILSQTCSPEGTGMVCVRGQNKEASHVGR